jgi:Carbohydrate binding module (family 6)
MHDSIDLISKSRLRKMMPRAFRQLRHAKVGITDLEHYYMIRPNSTFKFAFVVLCLCWLTGCRQQTDAPPVAAQEAHESPVSDADATTTPFGERPYPIPGKIEAENFDKGDALAAYRDRDEQNQGVDYRGPTQVDIEERNDASNGHGIGWTKKDEWVLYTVSVKEPGTYRVEIPVASNKLGGVFHLEFDGEDVTGPIQVPDTGSWQKLEVITKDNLQLKEGTQAMRIVMDSEGPSQSVADIDYLKFEKQERASDD